MEGQIESNQDPRIEEDKNFVESLAKGNKQEKSEAKKQIKEGQKVLKTIKGIYKKGHDKAEEKGDKIAHDLFQETLDKLKEDKPKNKNNKEEK